MMLVMCVDIGDPLQRDSDDGDGDLCDEDMDNDILTPWIIA